MFTLFNDLSSFLNCSGSYNSNYAYLFYKKIANYISNHIYFTNKIYLNLTIVKKINVKKYLGGIYW